MPHKKMCGKSYAVFLISRLQNNTIKMNMITHFDQIITNNFSLFHWFQLGHTGIQFDIAGHLTGFVITNSLL